jgi:hypothetical protein
LPELVVGQVPILVVARRSEVGRVDLQHKAGLDDGAVFGAHQIGKRGDISVLSRIMQIDDEARQDTGRRRGHEYVVGPLLLGGGLEVRDVAVERRAVLVAQFADAAGERHGAEIAAGLGKVRMLQHVAADHDVAAALGGARIGFNAGDAVPNIGRVRRLAHLAIADRVDAGGDLPRHHVLDRARRLGFEGAVVHRAPLLACEHKIDQRLRPRQAAGMGGENAVGRSFHELLLLRGSDRQPYPPLR